MMKWFIGVILLLVTIFGVLFWWLLLSGTPPKQASNVFPIKEWRELVRIDKNRGPNSIVWHEVNSDLAPSWVVQAGRFGRELPMTMGGLELKWRYSDGEEVGISVVIGGAVDEITATAMQQSDQWNFSQAAYDSLTSAMLNAQQVLITHEHLDHVMGIARHPNIDELAPKLKLNESQLSALGQFTIDGMLPPSLEKKEPEDFSKPVRIAPGVVVAPAAGHTAGSQVIYIRRADDVEILVIGDIVWNAENIKALKPRPMLTQFVVFDPKEDRAKIENQIRALHDLAVAEPRLIILPAHDRDLHERLVAKGVLARAEIR